VDLDHVEAGGDRHLRAPLEFGDERAHAGFDIAVADGTFGCTDTISMTVSCEWDAQGEMGQARAAAATALDTTSAAPANNAVARFMKCEVE